MLLISEKLLLNVEDLNDARTPLADFFSMLLTFLGRVGDERRIELLHFGAAAFWACHLGGLMFFQGQDHQRFLPAAQTVIVIHWHG
jgi:hypothetical protein